MGETLLILAGVAQAVAAIVAMMVTFSRRALRSRALTLLEILSSMDPQAEHRQDIEMAANRALRRVAQVENGTAPSVIWRLLASLVLAWGLLWLWLGYIYTFNRVGHDGPDFTDEADSLVLFWFFVYIALGAGVILWDMRRVRRRRLEMAAVLATEGRRG